MGESQNDFWTEQRVTILRQWAEAGLFASEIAKRLGTTRNAVLGKANRMGISLTGYERAESGTRMARARAARGSIMNNNQNWKLRRKIMALRRQAARLVAKLDQLYEHTKSAP